MGPLQTQLPSGGASVAGLSTTEKEMLPNTNTSLDES